MAAEKTSVDKARHAAKLVQQKAERAVFQVQLRNLQPPKARNQSIAARISRLEKGNEKYRKQHRKKSTAIEECKDQLLEYEEETETLRQKIEEGVAKLTQSYAEQKLVLTTIEGVGKEAPASPALADIMVGIESMQKTYTGFFSGADSEKLPQEVRDHKQEFETAFLQMQTIATKLASFQQTISRAIADAGGSAGSTAPGGTATTAGGEGAQPNPPAEGVQTVEQNPPQLQPAVGGATARTTSPDRGAGGEGSNATATVAAENKAPKEKTSRILLV